MEPKHNHFSMKIPFTAITRTPDGSAPEIVHESAHGPARVGQMIGTF